MELKAAIARVVAGSNLTAEEVAAVFGTIMDGNATPAQIGGLLIGLRMKGETADEIAGAARTMRARATPIQCPEPDRAVDTCGTGGDGSGSVNVSTVAAIIAAAAGVRVAKHGNRSLSSRSGSADVLERLGVKIDAPVPVLERCLQEVNIAFLFAPAFHAATKHAAAPRRELGTRTLFNLLGPLTNPAGVGNQIVGVFDAAWCQPVAAALGQLGARRAFVVHGEGGLDEVAVRGVTQVAEWDAGRGSVALRELKPADFGLAEEDPAELRGGEPEFNAEVARKVIGGATGAPRAAAVMEAALALVAAGVASDLRAAAEQAAAAIDSGAAATTLERWGRLSNGS
jgi:anthranilate phosphoribosyltransferase